MSREVVTSFVIYKDDIDVIVSTRSQGLNWLIQKFAHAIEPLVQQIISERELKLSLEIISAISFVTLEGGGTGRMG